MSGNGFKRMCLVGGGDLTLFGKVCKELDSQGYVAAANIDFGRKEGGVINADGYGGYTWYDRGISHPPGTEEINIDWMRTQQKETIELNGKTYIKEELEEALSKINPID